VFDDEEDALHLGLILQDIIQGRLDDLLARLNIAPSVGPNPLHYDVNFDRQ
jgi:hypothetical protein